jgi:hypothetical protein
VAFALAGVVLARRPVGLADRRRAIAVLLLGGLAVAWIGLVAAMTVRGFSGSTRYLMGPAALLIVLGAVGAAWTISAAAPRLRPPAAIVTAVVLAALFAAQNTPQLGPTLREIQYQANLYHDLERVIDDAGGAAYLRSCGHAFTDRFLVPQVAWRLRVQIGDVDFRPRGERAVLFHVRNTRSARLVPPYELARPNVLGRRGHWALTADCEARG